MEHDASFGLLTGNNIDAHQIKAGSVIFREGEAADQLFVIKSGEVRIQIGNRTVTELSAGDIFGEMALIDNEPRSATAVAVIVGKRIAAAGHDALCKTWKEAQPKGSPAPTS